MTKTFSSFSPDCAGQCFQKFNMSKKVAFLVPVPNLNENGAHYHTFLRPWKKMKKSELKRKYLAKSSDEYLIMFYMIFSLFPENFKSIVSLEVEIIAFKQKNHQKVAYDNLSWKASWKSVLYSSPWTVQQYNNRTDEMVHWWTENKTINHFLSLHKRD